jgi:hypothetical protein
VRRLTRGGATAVRVRNGERHANLRNLLVAHPDDLELALAETLAACSEKAAAQDGKGRGSFANYFAKTLRGKLEEMRANRLDLEAKARVASIKVAHEEKAAKMKLDALGDSIATNKERREKAAEQQRNETPRERKMREVAEFSASTASEARGSRRTGTSPPSPSTGSPARTGT